MDTSISRTFVVTFHAKLTPDDEMRRYQIELNCSLLDPQDPEHDYTSNEDAVVELSLLNGSLGILDHAYNGFHEVQNHGIVRVDKVCNLSEESLTYTPPTP